MKKQKKKEKSNNQLIGNKSFIALQAFMINDLGLYGDELIVYAKIYGLCKYVGVCYPLTAIEELSKWLNKSIDETIKVIETLYDKSLIKILGDDDNCYFNVNLSKLPQNELNEFNNVRMCGNDYHCPVRNLNDNLND